VSKKKREEVEVGKMELDEWARKVERFLRRVLKGKIRSGQIRVIGGGTLKEILETYFNDTMKIFKEKLKEHFIPELPEKCMILILKDEESKAVKIVCVETDVSTPSVVEVYTLS
jgi:cell division protein YceG involved in septum cleavage